MRPLVDRSATASEGGFALFYAISLTTVVAVLCSALLTLSVASHRSASSKNNMLRGRYLAEGAIEVVKKQIQADVANWQAPNANHLVDYDGVQSVVEVIAVGGQRLETDLDGVQKTLQLFELRSRAAVSGQVGHASRMVEVESIATFQYAVFYASDLEVSPGPDMTIGGRLHSNSDIYMSPGSTLTVNSNYLRSVGNMYRHAKNDPTRSSGTIQVRKFVDDPNDPASPTEWFTMNSRSEMAALGISSPDGFDSSFLGHDANDDGDFVDLGEWLPWGPGALEYSKEAGGGTYGTGSTLQDAAHGVSEALAPEFESIQMFEAVAGGDYSFNSTTGQFETVTSGTGTHQRGYYHTEADLKILVHEDNGFTVYDGSDIDITSSVAPFLDSEQIYDARQAEGSALEVDVLTIDLGLLSASAYFPSNGILYAARYGQGTGTDAGGIQLVNGSELKAGLTVVTEDSVYVQGDYNTVDPKPAAVICDALNLLSNNWDNSKSEGSATPSATDTTYKVSFVTGNYETNGSDYNGGLENLPRFHENWSGIKCSLRGSIVNLWESHYATGRWSSATYSAPIRDWVFDSDLNYASNLPPGTPLSVSARDVVEW